MTIQNIKDFCGVLIGYDKARIARKKYICNSIIYILLMAITFSLGNFYCFVGKNFGATIIGAMCFVAFCIFLIKYLILQIQRLHDINSSGCWVLAICIPIINVLFVLFLASQKGTIGNNKYGEDPLMGEIHWIL